MGHAPAGDLTRCGASDLRQRLHPLDPAREPRVAVDRLVLGEDRVEAIVVVRWQVAEGELEERVGGAVGGRQRVAEEMVASAEQALEDLDPSGDAAAARRDPL